MMCMKALEQENRRLRKMYVEENIKAEIVSEALVKNGRAISQARDGSTRGITLCELPPSSALLFYAMTLQIAVCDKSRARLYP